MRTRRFVVVGAVAAAALLAGMANAGAEPASDTSDRRGVEVKMPESAARAAVDPIPSEFVSVRPARVLDTRNSGTPVGQGGSVVIDLNGAIPTNATAVVLNVTATGTTGFTFVTAYPAAEDRPDASNLNLVPGQTRANQVTVGVNPDRLVALYNNAGSVHLIADLAGYYIDGTASLYNPVTPGRVLDTRGGAPVGAGGAVSIAFPWLADDVTTVTFNLTAIGATTNTFVTAFPAGQPVPLASNLNIGPGETVPNQVTVPLGTNKTVTLFNGNGSVHLIADMVGFYATGGGSWFVPVSPSRVLDTRPGFGLTPDVYIALTGWTPEVVGVSANVTGTNPSAAGYVVVYPGGAAIPFASNLNLVPGQTAANAVNVGVGFDSGVNDRSINFANSAGYVDVIFDIAGFFIV